MAERRQRLIDELYLDDPERADAIFFGRRTDGSRRGFLGGAGLTAMGAVLGAPVVFGAHMPGGLMPAALAQDAQKGAAGGQAPKDVQTLNFPGKDPGLVVLGDRPLVAETPEHLLDDGTTPTSKFYIRNNGQIPDAVGEVDKWSIIVDGEVNNKLELTVGELKSRFRAMTYRMVLECGGNGRAFFQPQARGNQWTNGGAGCAEWTGVPLTEVLKAAGLKDTAKYTAHYGADPHLSGNPSQDALSRGMPIAKAMEKHGLIVWAMNGEPLPNIHGGPVRLVIPGWPGSLSHKWLKKITVRDREHDGQGMTGTSYRVTIKPMIPGGKAEDSNFRILESMPVRSIITNPSNGARLSAGTRARRSRSSSRCRAWATTPTSSRAAGAARSRASPRPRPRWTRGSPGLAGRPSPSGSSMTCGAPTGASCLGLR